MIKILSLDKYIILGLTTVGHQLLWLLYNCYYFVLFGGHAQHYSGLTPSTVLRDYS